MKIAYTIGNVSSYDKALDTGDEVVKLGKTDNYSGGYVWQTAKEAQNFIDADNIIIDGIKRDKDKFAVYELRLNDSWDRDVSLEVDEDGVHNLINNAVVVRKIIKENENEVV